MEKYDPSSGKDKLPASKGKGGRKWKILKNDHHFILNKVKLKNDSNSTAFSIL